MVGDLPFGTYEASDEQADRHRAPLRQGGGLRRRQARGRRPDGPARTRHRRGRHAGHGPRRPDAADRDRARRLPRPGPHGRARRTRCSRTRSRSRTAGCFSIVFEAIPNELTDLIMEHMEIPVIGIGAGPEHRRPGARLPRPARHQRRVQAEVRQALRRAAPDDGRRRDRPTPRTSGPAPSPARSTPTASPRRRWSGSKEMLAKRAHA